MIVSSQLARLSSNLCKAKGLLNMIKVRVNVWGIKVLFGLIALMCSANFGFSAECKDDANSCTLQQLCQMTTINSAAGLSWNNDAAVANHLNLVQNLGLNCGDVKDICDLDPNQCKLNQICDRATTLDNGVLNWNFDNLGHVVLAKEYGLDCDVGKISDKSDQNMVTFKKRDFYNLDNFRRKQVQYGLKQLGYYRSEVDGVWGKGTDNAIQNYANDRNLTANFPNSLYAALENEVDLDSFLSSAGVKDGAAKSNRNNKKICNLSNPIEFKRLYAVKYREKTEERFKGLESIVLNASKIMHVGKTIEQKDDKWRWSFEVRCYDSRNNWSPCGSPYATVQLKSANTRSLEGKISIPWEWSSVAPSVVDLKYICK